MIAVSRPYGRRFGRLQAKDYFSKGYGTGECRMADLIVQSAVKDHLDNHNVASDFYDALDEEVAELLEDAAQRAEDNDRKTVQARDL